MLDRGRKPLLDVEPVKIETAFGFYGIEVACVNHSNDLVLTR